MRRFDDIGELHGWVFPGGASRSCDRAVGEGAEVTENLFDLLKAQNPEAVDINTHPELDYAAVYYGVRLFVFQPIACSG